MLAWLDSWPRHSFPAFSIALIGVGLMFVGQLLADIWGIVLILTSGMVLTYVCFRQRQNSKSSNQRAASTRRTRGAVLFTAMLLIFAGYQMLIHQAPRLALWSKQAEYVTLYYGDRELNGRTITLEHGCHPSACVKMHVWPWPNPDSFGVYGVWIRRPAVSPPFGTSGRLFLEFSEDVAPKAGSAGCSVNPEGPHAGYKVAFICLGSPTAGEARWTLPFSNFTLLAPPRRLSVRMKFEYGEIQSDAAAFTLRPAD